MRRGFLLAMSVVLGCFTSLAETPAVPEGFRPIFNGKDLRGWHISRTNHHGVTPDVRVVDGAIVMRQNPIGEGGILLTDRKFADYELYVEVNPDDGCDGGIFLRSNEDGNAYQITVDYVPKGDIGEVYGEDIPGVISTFPTEWQKYWKKHEWNALRIRTTGQTPHLTVWLNGHQILDFQDSKNHALGEAVSGMVALQIHYTNTTTARFKPHSALRYRAIAIKELP